MRFKTSWLHLKRLESTRIMIYSAISSTLTVEFNRQRPFKCETCQKLERRWKSYHQIIVLTTLQIIYLWQVSVDRRLRVMKMDALRISCQPRHLKGNQRMSNLVSQTSLSIVAKIQTITMMSSQMMLVPLQIKKKLQRGSKEKPTCLPLEISKQTWIRHFKAVLQLNS